jgi:hypothetical protein
MEGAFLLTFSCHADGDFAPSALMLKERAFSSGSVAQRQVSED